jgi:hypothetical protein
LAAQVQEEAEVEPAAELEPGPQGRQPKLGLK